MADERQFNADDRALFEAEYERLRREALPRAREEEIKAAAQRAVQRDLEIERENYREELDAEVTQATAETAAEERAEATRQVPSKFLMLTILLIVLLMLLAATGRLRTLFARAEPGDGISSARGSLPAALQGPTTTPVGGAGGLAASGQGQPVGRGNPNAGGVDAPGTVPGMPAVAVDPFFQAYYDAHNGLRVFGLPLSPVMIVNGRRIQWFERARLEDWSEHPDPNYQIQPGLVGREYTQGREFPTQKWFPSRPGLVYFEETQHALGGIFLDYWTNNGGLDIFGYPISEVIPEVLEDGRIYSQVQYFERARMEFHPEQSGTGNEIMLGLLGRALYLNEPRPEVIPVPRPTEVPLP